MSDSNTSSYERVEENANVAKATGGSVHNYSSLKDWAIGLCLGASVITNVALWFAYSERTTETRMLEYYVMELDGKLMSAGLIDYNASWAARKKQREQEIHK